MLTAERARELLDYDPVTGALIWKVDKGSIKAGWSAGGLQSQGYMQIGLDGRKYRCHRVAWLIMTGEWPSEVDHINLDKADNRWANLRLATRRQNSANRAGSGELGVKGVYFNKQRGKYQAQIRIGGKQTCLGRFDTVEEAREAYRQAAMREFGDFARTE